MCERILAVDAGVLASHTHSTGVDPGFEIGGCTKCACKRAN